MVENCNKSTDLYLLKYQHGDGVNIRFNTCIL